MTQPYHDLQLARLGLHSWSVVPIGGSGARQGLHRCLCWEHSVEGAEVTCRGQLLMYGSRRLGWRGGPERPMISTDEITAHLTAGKMIDHLIAIRTLVAHSTHTSQGANSVGHAGLSMLSMLSMRIYEFTLNGTYQADGDRVHPPAEDVVRRPYV
jgi:hypothetical protein